MTNQEKIETILRSDWLNWEQLTRQQLMELLLENRRFFLDTEVEYGNDEYLDELLEEIDVPAVWSTAV
jgi:hypothetical protein